ncbi:phosphate acetyltransferase [Volvox carteri f. nagariensis]|uniref:phosphate acetyltransferase n=1 Tax=Volvox carteri f. nagariensis TaxID=3068 RepID=D8TT79_VOLCA|nr:phosphate acetyltransferase [Volvox carteri f. nagariensis]EFJ49262.1 phosphate acetyltransferase [Volvox carteri f. nagariensis]|eukprot:XP_002949710.1 phosphate acetyltransferase [Volvox carteri f. nagariensis]
MARAANNTLLMGKHLIMARSLLAPALREGIARLLHGSLSTLGDAMSAHSRSFTTGNGNGGADSLFISDINLSGHRTPLLLGLMNYFEKHLPKVGYFQPITGRPSPDSKLKADRTLELMHSVFKMTCEPDHMVGVQEAEAARLIAAGKQAELLDRIYAAYVSYKEGHDVVLVDGPGQMMGDTELDAQIASALGSPVLMAMMGNHSFVADDYYQAAVFKDCKVEVLGLVLHNLPRGHHAILTSQLQTKLERVGLPFAGALPDDPLLSSVRLDDVRLALSAEQLYGDSLLTDVEFDDVVVASQRLEELLEVLGERPGGRPLVVTSADRLDIVLGLLAAQLSVKGPGVAGVLLTQAGTQRAGRNYAKSTVDTIFAGLAHSGLYQGTLLPVLSTDRPLREALAIMDRLDAAILPDSTRKVERSKHVVLPESVDKRVLAAAAEATARGLARITLLGDPATVASEGKKLGLDLGGCRVVHPASSDRLDTYISMLVEARRQKGMTAERAADLLLGDINFFATMMVAAGDADGMVSGAIHTTASTIRPALQVLKTPDMPLVSSVFFMCLPDRVLVYGDCAVNVNPSASDLASIAITSADTAAAFGIEPRVAMLSYSTLGSGSGPDVEKVTEAVALVKSRRPDILVEGPIQYDAAIDPAVAAVKVKGGSEVAGKATVFVFPDLNTGNNTYKAVQQSTGAIAMGPVMQGLLKPVNDLSRGCTVPDILNTVCVTSIQAMQFKKSAAAAAASASGASSAATGGKPNASAAILEAEASGADILDNSSALQAGIFGVLFTVTKEKYNTGWRFLTLKLVLDYLQLFTLTFTDTEPWVFDDKNILWKVAQTVNIDQVVAPLGYNFFIGLLYIMVGLLMLMMGLSLWVAWCFKNRSFPSVWPIKVLRVYAYLFFQILDVLTLSLFQVPFNCRYIGYDPKEVDYMANYPDVKCSAFPHVVHMVTSGCALLVFVVFALLNLGADFELSPLEKGLLTVANGQVEVQAFVVKFAMTFVSYAIGWEKVRLVLLLVLAAALTYLYLRWSPHLVSWVNHLRVGLYTSVLLSAVLAVVLVHGPAGPPEALEAHRRRITTLLWALIGPAALLGAAASYCRLNVWSAYVLKRFREGPPGEKARRIYKFGDPREVEIVSRVCRKWVDQHREILDKRAVKEGEIIIKAGLQLFPGRCYMLILYSNYLIDVLDNSQTGYSQMAAAKQAGPDWMQRFAIFAREQEQLQRLSSARGGESGVDLVSYVEYQKNHRLVIRAHKDALIATRTFWQVLLHNHVRFTALAAALNEIERTVLKAESAYKMVLSRYPTNAKLARTYGRFLENVVNNPWKAAKYYVLAERLTEMQEADEAAGAEMAASGGGGGGEAAVENRLLHRVDERVNAVFIINANGIIQMANKNACSLLGYETVLNTVVSLPALHKDRYVIPVRVGVTKVSGAADSSTFMGVLEPIAQERNEANVYLLPGGTVAAVDRAFVDWFAKELDDCIAQHLADLTADEASAIAIRDAVERIAAASKAAAAAATGGATANPRASASVFDAAAAAAAAARAAAAAASHEPPPIILLRHKYARPVRVSVRLQHVGVGSEVLLCATLTRTDPPDSLVLVDGRGRIGFITSELAEALGATPEGLARQPIADLLPQPWNALHANGGGGWLREAEASMGGLGSEIQGDHQTHPPPGLEGVLGMHHLMHASGFGGGGDSSSAAPSQHHRVSQLQVMQASGSTSGGGGGGGRPGGGRASGGGGRGGGGNGTGSNGAGGYGSVTTAPPGSCLAGATVVLGSSSKVQDYYRVEVSRRGETVTGQPMRVVMVRKSSLAAALSERRLAVVVDAATGTVLEAGDSPASLFGFKPAALVGRNIADVVSALRPPTVSPSSSANSSSRVGVTPPMDERNLEVLGLLRGAFISRQTRPAVMEVDVLVPGGEADDPGFQRHESAPIVEPGGAVSLAAAAAAAVAETNGGGGGLASSPGVADANRTATKSMLYGPTFKEMHERGLLSVEAAATIEAGLTALTGGGGGGRSWGPAQAWPAGDMASKAATLRLRVNLWRAEVLGGVLEVDGQGEVVNVAHAKLHQTGLLFGLNTNQLPRMRLSRLLNMPVGDTTGAESQGSVTAALFNPPAGGAGGSSASGAGGAGGAASQTAGKGAGGAGELDGSAARRGVGSDGGAQPGNAVQRTGSPQTRVGGGAIGSAPPLSELVGSKDSDDLMLAGIVKYDAGGGTAVGAAVATDAAAAAAAGGSPFGAASGTATADAAAAAGTPFSSSAAATGLDEDDEYDESDDADGDGDGRGGSVTGRSRAQESGDGECRSVDSASSSSSSSRSGGDIRRGNSSNLRVNVDSGPAATGSTGPSASGVARRRKGRQGSEVAPSASGTRRVILNTPSMKKVDSGGGGGGGGGSGGGGGGGSGGYNGGGRPPSPLPTWSSRRAGRPSAMLDNQPSLQFSGSGGGGVAAVTTAGKGGGGGGGGGTAPLGRRTSVRHVDSAMQPHPESSKVGGGGGDDGGNGGSGGGGGDAQGGLFGELQTALLAVDAGVAASDHTRSSITLGGMAASGVAAGAPGAPDDPDEVGSQGSAVSGMDEEVGGAAHQADYRRGKRFKKLAAMLGSPLVQRAARDFRWQALLANVAQVVSNLISFVLLTLLLHTQIKSVGRLTYTANGLLLAHELFIDLVLLDNLHRGLIPNTSWYDSNSLAKFSSSVEASLVRFEQHHSSSYLDSGTARITDAVPYNPSDLIHNWNYPAWPVIDYYSVDPPRVDMVNKSLWELGTSIWVQALDVHHMQTSLAAAKLRNRTAFLDAPLRNLSAPTNNDPFTDIIVARHLAGAYTRDTTDNSSSSSNGSSSSNISWVTGIWTVPGEDGHGGGGGSGSSSSTAVVNWTVPLLNPGLSWSDAWRFVLSAGPTQLYQGYHHTLLALTDRAVTASNNINRVQLVLMLVEGCAVATLLVTYMWWLQHRVTQQRYRVYGVFMAVPVGMIRALASRTITISQGSDSEEDSDDDEYQQQQQQQLSAATQVITRQFSAANSSSSFQSAGGFLGFLSQWRVLSRRNSSSLNPGGAGRTSRASRKLHRRRMIRNSRDSLKLLIPFVVWGVAICIIYATGYYYLQQVQAPVNLLSVIDSAIISVHRLMLYSLLTCSELAAHARVMLRELLASELRTFKLQWDVMLYGANGTTSSVDRRFGRIQEGVSFIADDLARILYRAESCRVFDTEGWCPNISSPFYAATEHGLSYMVERLVEDVEGLLAESLEFADINSTRLAYIMTVGQGPLQDAFHVVHAETVTIVDNYYKVVDKLHIAAMVLSWVLAVCFLFCMLRPFLHRNRGETNRIAKMLSQLPAEVDIEGLVFRLLLGAPAMRRRNRRASVSSLVAEDPVLAAKMAQAEAQAEKLEEAGFPQPLHRSSMFSSSKSRVDMSADAAYGSGADGVSGGGADGGGGMYGMMDHGRRGSALGLYSPPPMSPSKYGSGGGGGGGHGFGGEGRTVSGLSTVDSGGGGSASGGGGGGGGQRRTLGSMGRSLKGPSLTSDTLGTSNGDGDGSGGGGGGYQQGRKVKGRAAWM